MSHTAAISVPIPEACRHSAAAEQHIELKASARKASANGMGRTFWLLLCAGAFGAGWMLSGGGRKPEAKVGLPPASEAGTDAVAVTAEPVARRPVQRSVEATGTLAALEE